MIQRMDDVIMASRASVPTKYSLWAPMWHGAEEDGGGWNSYGGWIDD